MAKFHMELPTEIMKDFDKIHGNCEKIFGEMTKAGAEVVAENVRANAPLPEIARGVKITKIYKTPSDDGINTKVYISGVAPLKNGRESFTRRGRPSSQQYTTYKGVPLEFLASIFEYGTSPRYTNLGAYRGYIGKKPYFRKAFKKNQIEKIMKDVQNRESGGLLKDE